MREEEGDLGFVEDWLKNTRDTKAGVSREVRTVVQVWFRVYRLRTHTEGVVQHEYYDTLLWRLFAYLERAERRLLTV